MTFGWGVFKGMMVTLKNFATSYVCRPDQGGIFTVQYPEEREKIFENFRNFPFLVYDGAPEKIRCVACGICERECPPKCIHIEMESDSAGKPTRKPAVFDIDYGLCMNCGICEEVCPFDSIFMDHAFEVAAAERAEGLVRSKEELARSNEYFQKVRPTLASVIDQKRKAAEEKRKAQAQSPETSKPK
jgi:NADH-quinone oxidoreductase subunit I